MRCVAGSKRVGWVTPPHVALSQEQEGGMGHTSPCTLSQEGQIFGLAITYLSRHYPSTQTEERLLMVGVQGRTRLIMCIFIGLVCTNSRVGA